MKSFIFFHNYLIINLNFLYLNQTLTITTLMEMKDVNTFLNLDFQEDNKIWLTNSKTLRKVIGILGMALPLLLVLFLFVDSGLHHPLESISHYYYTRVNSIFIFILGALGLFLIIYRGFKPIDFFVSCTAGIFALFVVFFPTGNLGEMCCDTQMKYAVTYIKPSAFRVGFHYVSAGIFLSCLSYMSIVLFTKSDKSAEHRGSRKITRNRIYRICGVLMILAILVIVAGLFEIIPDKFYTDHHLTFWMETLAVESFGFSWLIKGDTFFQDSKLSADQSKIN